MWIMVHRIGPSVIRAHEGCGEVCAPERQVSTGLRLELHDFLGDEVPVIFLIAVPPARSWGGTAPCAPRGDSCNRAERGED
jgi:hypothetical protein